MVEHSIIRTRRVSDYAGPGITRLNRNLSSFMAAPLTTILAKYTLEPRDNPDSSN